MTGAALNGAAALFQRWRDDSHDFPSTLLPLARGNGAVLSAPPVRSTNRACRAASRSSARPAVRVSVLGCCVRAERARLITPLYSGARCRNGPAGVTRCGVVLPEETKMQCTIGGVIWPGARFGPGVGVGGVNPPVAVPTPRSGLRLWPNVALTAANVSFQAQRDRETVPPPLPVWVTPVFSPVSPGTRSPPPRLAVIASNG